MSLVISLGSNLGDKEANLALAKEELDKYFSFIEKSRIYSSKAVEFTDQPDFLNQVLSYKTPKLGPTEVLSTLLRIEHKMGRRRDIPKGPRTIDIDLLFYNTDRLELPDLSIPHPRLFERSFIVLPLKELKIYNTLSNHFQFPESFCNDAFPLTNV